MSQDLELKKKIGKRIENIRKEMNLTKESLAKMLGVTGQYLGIVEKGESALSYEKLMKLCEISKCSADYILFGKDNKISKQTEDLLSEFSDYQIEEACEIIKKIALFIKNSNK